YVTDRFIGARACAPASIGAARSVTLGSAYASSALASLAGRTAAAVPSAEGPALPSSTAAAVFALIERNRRALRTHPGIGWARARGTAAVRLAIAALAVRHALTLLVHAVLVGPAWSACGVDADTLLAFESCSASTFGATSVVYAASDAAFRLAVRGALRAATIARVRRRRLIHLETAWRRVARGPEDRSERPSLASDVPQRIVSGHRRPLLRTKGEHRIPGPTKGR